MVMGMDSTQITFVASPEYFTTLLWHGTEES